MTDDDPYDEIGDQDQARRILEFLEGFRMLLAHPTPTIDQGPFTDDPKRLALVELIEQARSALADDPVAQVQALIDIDIRTSLLRGQWQIEGQPPTETKP